MRQRSGLTLVATLLLAGSCPDGAAAADVVAPGAKLEAPPAVALGGALNVRSKGLTRPVRIERRTSDGWVPAGEPIRKVGASTALRAPTAAQRWRLRGRGADGRVSRSLTVRVRPLVMAAVGDINFGDGPGDQIAAHGPGYPWASVGSHLKAADLAFGNLECAVSLRGTPQEKMYVFRGRPSSLRAMATNAGMDVVNLANNHAGDYGDRALLDTLRTARDAGVATVGAGATAEAAYRPRIVEKLGLRIAFVGFSTILPYEFQAVGSNPGTAWGHAARVRAGVQRAKADADVVIATFHWGIERDTTESAQQRDLAAVAIDAGATAVIGAHPHVLQPLRRPPGRLIAYSLGNFVFSASSPGTQRTGILDVSLGAGRVVGTRFVRATIRASRPVLD
ncbi:MAG: CapA family protein [Solirubrobacteraceae bacterium]|nr:CapA family protein [Solirubrobacteraceae bacterium]